MLKRALFETFHRWTGELKTVECQDWVQRKNPGKAQKYTSKEETMLRKQVSHLAVVKNLGVSSSTIHNIIKWFWEPGEI